MMKCVAAGHEIVALANLQPSGRGTFIFVYDYYALCTNDLLTKQMSWTASCFRLLAMKAWL